MNNKRPKLVAFMNAYSQGISGGDNAFIELAKRINDFDIIIVTSLMGKMLCLEKGLKADFILTTKESRFTNTIYIYLKRILKSILLKIKLDKGDILFGTSDSLPDTIPIFILKKRNRHIAWVQKFYHFMPCDRKISYLSQRLSLWMIRKLSDLVILGNNYIKDEFLSFGFKKKQVTVSYPCIDLSMLKFIKPGKNRYDCVFMGQLRPQKGILDIINIWKLVCRSQSDARLAIIGSGEDIIIKKVKDLIKSNKLESNIDLLGYIPGNEVFSIIKASKLFVSPSHEEGFGIASLEAQACSLPVIAWDLEVYNEIFPEGFIKIKRYDIESFANKVIEALNNEYIYRDLSQKAIDNASSFNCNNMAEKEIELIKSTIKTKN